MQFLDMVVDVPVAVHDRCLWRSLVVFTTGAHGSDV